MLRGVPDTRKKKKKKKEARAAITIYIPYTVSKITWFEEDKYVTSTNYPESIRKKKKKEKKRKETQKNTKKKPHKTKCNRTERARKKKCDTSEKKKKFLFFSRTPRKILASSLCPDQQCRSTVTDVDGNTHDDVITRKNSMYKRYA